jgi:hypothetical protein
MFIIWLFRAPTATSPAIRTHSRRGEHRSHALLSRMLHQTAEPQMQTLLRAMRLLHELRRLLLTGVPGGNGVLPESRREADPYQPEDHRHRRRDLSASVALRNPSAEGPDKSIKSEDTRAKGVCRFRQILDVFPRETSKHCRNRTLLPIVLFGRTARNSNVLSDFPRFGLQLAFPSTGHFPLENSHGRRDSPSRNPGTPDLAT